MLTYQQVQKHFKGLKPSWTPHPFPTRTTFLGKPLQTTFTATFQGLAIGGSTVLHFVASKWEDGSVHWNFTLAHGATDVIGQGRSFTKWLQNDGTLSALCYDRKEFSSLKEVYEAAVVFRIEKGIL